MFGRVTYDMMASFWPTPMGKSANPVFANALNNTPKIVFSRTMEKADWQNTTVLKELTTEETLRIKIAAVSLLDTKNKTHPENTESPKSPASCFSLYPMLYSL